MQITQMKHTASAAAESGTGSNCKARKTSCKMCTRHSYVQPQERSPHPLLRSQSAVISTAVLLLRMPLLLRSGVCDARRTKGIDEVTVVIACSVAGAAIVDESLQLATIVSHRQTVILLHTLTERKSGAQPYR